MSGHYERGKSICRYPCRFFFLIRLFIFAFFLALIFLDFTPLKIIRLVLQKIWRIVKLYNLKETICLLEIYLRWVSLRHLVIMFRTILSFYCFFFLLISVTHSLNLIVCKILKKMKYLIREMQFWKYYQSYPLKKKLQ